MNVLLSYNTLGKSFLSPKAGPETYLAYQAHALANPEGATTAITYLLPITAANCHPLQHTTAAAPAIATGADMVPGKTWTPATCPEQASLLRAITLCPFPDEPETHGTPGSPGG